MPGDSLATTVSYNVLDLPMLLFCLTDSTEGLPERHRYGSADTAHRLACLVISSTPWLLMNKHVMWPFGMGEDNLQFVKAYGIPIVGRDIQYLDESGMIPVLGGSQRVVQC